MQHLSNDQLFSKLCTEYYFQYDGVQRICDDHHSEHNPIHIIITYTLLIALFSAVWMSALLYSITCVFNIDKYRNALTGMTFFYLLYSQLAVRVFVIAEFLNIQ